MMVKRKGDAEVAIFAVIFVFIIALALYQPYREKETYNKFKDPSQPKATYWDAVFSELRITSK
jgi:uncharacterized protein YybS (DUF2232 family)